jgi:3-polyprenyl-4-hydroxybenzoate decarboxylase
MRPLIVAAVFPLLCLSACNSTSGQGAAVAAENSVAEDATLDADVRCLIRQAAALDDGISPADAVGRAVSSACTATFQASAMAFLPSGSRNLANVAGFRQTHIDSATQVVLRRRASRR